MTDRGVRRLALLGGMLWLGGIAAASDQPGDEAWIVGHRGDVANWPENSIEGIRSAWNAGCAAEVDVRMSADGGLVLMHDETIDRTAVYRGVVAEMTMEELLQIDVGRRRSSRFWGVMLPSLEAVLEAARDEGGKLVLHLKETGTFRAVRELLESVGGPAPNLVVLVDAEGKHEAKEVFGDSAYRWWIATGMQARHMTFGAMLRESESGAEGLVFLYYEGGPTALEVDLITGTGLKFGSYTPSGGTDVPGMVAGGVDLVLNNFPRRSMRLVADEIWQAWKTEHGVEDLDEDDDPNGDGVPMLMEFATGLSPLGVEDAVERPSGPPVLVRRRVGVVEVTPEWSSDLVDWIPGRRPEERDGYERWRVSRY